MIIVIILLAGAVIINLLNKNIIENAKMAKFASNYKEIEERLHIYISERLLESTLENKDENSLSRLPVKGEITEEEKEEIKLNNQTLQKIIEEITGKTIDEVNIYWLDNELLQTKQKDIYI